MIFLFQFVGDNVVVFLDCNFPKKIHEFLWWLNFVQGLDLGVRFRVCFELLWWLDVDLGFVPATYDFPFDLIGYWKLERSLSPIFYGIPFYFFIPDVSNFLCLIWWLDGVQLEYFTIAMSVIETEIFCVEIITILLGYLFKFVQ